MFHGEMTILLAVPSAPNYSTLWICGVSSEIAMLHERWKLLRDHESVGSRFRPASQSFSAASQRNIRSNWSTKMVCERPGPREAKATPRVFRPSLCQRIGIYKSKHFLGNLCHQRIGIHDLVVEPTTNGDLGIGHLHHGREGGWIELIFDYFAPLWLSNCSVSHKLKAGKTHV